MLGLSFRILMSIRNSTLKVSDVCQRTRFKLRFWGRVCVCVMTQERKSVFQFCCLKRCSEDSVAFVRLAFLCE